MTLPPPSLPAYGRASLADLMPAALAGLGLRGFQDILGLPPFARVVILLIDGMGDELLERHRELAPVLSRALPASRSLTTGFPSTTAAGITSVGTGLPPGQHGLVGYTMAVPGLDDRPLSVLRWTPYGEGPSWDLREELRPQSVQPLATAFERCRDAGIPAYVVSPGQFAGSGFTESGLRGGHYLGASSLDNVVANIVMAATAAAHTLTYAYFAHLDLAGHATGVGSASWCALLTTVDRAVGELVERLPSDTLLAVTADHGMTNVAPEHLIDIDDHQDLARGVRLLAGEPRARYLHVEPGAESDVLETWRAVLGDRMWIVTRDEAVHAGWFGPAVRPEVLPRIGDVIAAARGEVGVYQSSQSTEAAHLIGHHGSLTTAEQMVPLRLFLGHAAA